MPSERRKRHVDKSSPTTDPDPPLPSVTKRHRPASKPTHSTQPGQGRSADALEQVTASLASVSVGAPVHPQVGTVPQHDRWGPIAAATPGSWSYDQAEQSRTNLSAGYGQSGTHPSAGYGQSSAYLSSQSERYPAYPSVQPGQPSAYPSVQPGQYPAYPSFQPGQYPTYPSVQPGQYEGLPSSQHGKYEAYPSGELGQYSRLWEDAEDERLVYYTEQYDRKRNKWALIAEAMSTEFKQDIKPLDCEKRWNSDEGKAKREFLVDRSALEDEDWSQRKNEDWSQREDDELVYLKGEYDHEYKKWAFVVRGMARATFNRTELSCRDRWNYTLKAKNPNLKLKDWSKEDDDRLTKLVKNFRAWNTLNPWDMISEQMGMLGSRRVPEYCRARWQDTLRGPANFGDWSKAEEKILLEFDSTRNIVELIDLLERGAHSIRTSDFVRAKLAKLRKDLKVKAQESTFDWSPEAVNKLHDMYKGKKRCDYKKGAEVLNSKFRTNVFTKDEVEKKWKMIK